MMPNLEDECGAFWYHSGGFGFILDVICTPIGDKGRAHNETKVCREGQSGAKTHPGGANSDLKVAKREPRAPTKEPKGSPKRGKASQKVPKGSQNGAKGRLNVSKSLFKVVRKRCP